MPADRSTETEVKLIASPAMLLRLRDHPLLAGTDQSATLVSRYFDTPVGTLRRHKATLRVREGGSRREQTFKIASANGAAVVRGEWNVPLTANAPDPTAFPPEPRALLDDLLTGEPLHPLATTRIERTSRRLRFGASTIDAAFDCGAMEAGPRDEAVSELELELIDGQAHDMFLLARKLPLGPDLMWSTLTKSERSLALADAENRSAERARPVTLVPGMDVAAGFRAVAWNCMTHLLANYGLVVATGDPAAVHQSRVAIRRLRAAFSIFAPAVTDDLFPLLKAEWKAAGAGLGPARDIHVLIERVEAAGNHGSLPEGSWDALVDKRAAATLDAQAMLAGSAFQDLLLQTADWLEAGAWGANAAGRKLLAPFAAKLLTKRRRQLVHEGRKLSRQSDDALHALRIRGKKLRYAAEFFAGLVDGKHGRRDRDAFTNALGKLQNRLGSLHDRAVAEAEHETLFADLDPAVTKLLESHGPSRSDLIEKAGDALAKVRKSPAWWGDCA